MAGTSLSSPRQMVIHPGCLSQIGLIPFAKTFMGPLSGLAWRAKLLAKVNGYADETPEFFTGLVMSMSTKTGREKAALVALEKYLDDISNRTCEIPGTTGFAAETPILTPNGSVLVVTI